MTTHEIVQHCQDMAVARTVELGSLDLVSTTTGLQLHFSSVLHFASFGKDDIDSPKLTLESLTSDTLLRPFVRAADRFKLVLSLRFSVELNSASEDELLGKFSAAIEKAEVSCGLLQSKFVIVY